MSKQWTVFFLWMAITGVAYSQTTVSGKITKKGTTELLSGVSVINLSQQRFNISDLEGNYKIIAAAGNLIIFSSAGYASDTIQVTNEMFLAALPVELPSRVITLPTVQIGEMNAYQTDSMQRRKDYQFIYDIKHPVTLINDKRPGDDPGFSFSPIGYFSKKEKQKRRLLKMLVSEEQAYYVNYRFSAARVTQLTGLSGDSLQEFMFRYRPSYSFCRGASNQDLLLYINDRLVLFHKKTG